MANATPSGSASDEASQRFSSTDNSETDSSQNINWKERCAILEETLYKFKHQASTIRDLLAEKVSFFVDHAVHFFSF